MEDFLELHKRFLCWSCKPEAAVLGPIASIKDGDEIILDAHKGIIELLVTNEELNMRKKKSKLKKMILSGALWKFSQRSGFCTLVMTHPGGKKRKKIYSDI